MKTMKKRSITVSGHRTSLTLEDEFWTELQRLASERGISLNILVTEIDAARNLSVNLSSALRLYVLKALKG
jgi:predicted DNA-binding ribbon-helix-helix protein